MRIGVLLAAMFVLATPFVAGQTATGIHLVNVRFSGDTRLETADLRKCAADLKSRMYEGAEWLDHVTELVRRQCFQDKGYFKVLIEPLAEQLPDKHGTHQFVVTFNLNAGSQYRIGQISFKNNRVLSAEELGSMFKLTSGDIFSPSKIRQGLDQIHSAYLDRGYPNLTMFPDVKIDDSHQVIGVVIECDEGKQLR
jgi:outer membrane protein assembly factor BamA